MLKKIFLILLCIGCSRKPPEAATRPLVLVSIAPYQFLVERIAGGELGGENGGAARANPHVFEPTSRQMREIGGGAVWFQIGEPFEEKILPALR